MSAINLLNKKRSEKQQRQAESIIGGIEEGKENIRTQIFKTKMQYIKKYTERENQIDGILQKYAQDVAIQRVDNHLPNKVSSRLRDIIKAKQIEKCSAHQVGNKIRHQKRAFIGQKND